MRWTPKWAQWQADNPPRGIDADVNRRFWIGTSWGVRAWLLWAVLIVLSTVALLIALLISAR